ncbi:peptidase M61 [Urechidicola sp. KH5]
MRKLIVLFLLAGALCSANNNSEFKPKQANIAFTINLNDRSDDTFKVKVTVPKLDTENNIFQFASTAPGTYQVMDMGRYVQSFIALDKKGRMIRTTQISTNQFEISKPKKVRTIIYEIAETYDTPVTENSIYPMAGSSIEDDHAIINGQTVFGYLKGLQDLPMKITIERPESWKMGTALTPNSEGILIADNYDHVVDSPILLGKLSKASTKVSNTIIDVYSYSTNDKIEAQQALESVENMITSADKFLGGLPVDHYTFLLFFETNPLSPKGAWEHSYSSFYVYDENTWENIETSFKHVASHEFFHVVTPLNIHSEIIEEFNFIEPIPSQHLWLYEGVTEWAAHAMMYCADIHTDESYFMELRRKVYIDSNYFDADYSLLDLALKSYTEEGHKQYSNIYMRGALVAGLLDIRLLELSNGEVGLIDVIKKMAKTFGPNTPFDEATFFEYFTNETYPEIADFFELYVKNTNELPLEEYYAKIGVSFNSEAVTFGFSETPTKEQLDLRRKWMKKLD